MHGYSAHKWNRNTSCGEGLRKLYIPILLIHGYSSNKYYYYLLMPLCCYIFLILKNQALHLCV